MLLPPLAPWLLTAPVNAAGGAPAPAKADARLRPPETTVHGYRIVVERVGQQQSYALEFKTNAAGAAEGAAERRGRQAVSVHLAVYPPDPKQINQIDSLDPRVLAYTGTNTPTPLRAFQYDDTSPEVAGVWRAQVVAQELDASISRLERLHGELVVYPRARKLALDLPLAGKAPRTQEAEGFRATIKQVRQGPGSVSVVVEMQYASSLNVSFVSPDAPGGVSALSPAGAVLAPGSSSTSNGEKGGMVIRQQSVTFTDMRELPAKIRVEALLRTGTPQKLPFTIPEVVLPHAFRTEADTDAADGTVGVLEPGHPLFAVAGGTVEIGAPDGAAGRLLLGLSRQENGEWGPWRRLEVTAAGGRAVVGHLRPGRYRVTRQWTSEATPGRASDPVRGAAQEIEVTAGATVRLPAAKGAK